MASVKQVLEVFLGQNLKPRALPYATPARTVEVRAGPNGMFELWFLRGRGYYDNGPKLLAVRYGCMVNVATPYRHHRTSRTLVSALETTRSVSASHRWLDLQASQQPSEFMAWGGWNEATPPQQREGIGIINPVLSAATASWAAGPVYTITQAVTEIDF